MREEANPSIQDSIPSEWPLALLLDEMWLRSRRTVVRELERRALWLERQQYRDSVVRLMNIGTDLKEEVLRPALAEPDYRALGSEALFGPANGRFRARLPLILSFGYELAYCLARRGGATEGEARERGHLCAIFNLGISVFDQIHDSTPELADRLGSVFDERVLASLVDEPRMASANLGARSAGLEDAENRILLALIVRFFLGLQQSEHRQDIGSLLARAYCAEMASAGLPTDRQAPDTVAEAKSTLPFAIIATLAAGDDRGHRVLVEIGRSLGRAFWLLDDLADTVLDIRTRSLNSLLADGRVTEADDYAAVDAFVRGRAAETAAEAVAESLERSLVAFDAGGSGALGVRFRTGLLAYARNWVE